MAGGGVNCLFLRTNLSNFQVNSKFITVKLLFKENFKMVWKYLLPYLNNNHIESKWNLSVSVIWSPNSYHSVIAPCTASEENDHSSFTRNLLSKLKIWRSHWAKCLPPPCQEGNTIHPTKKKSAKKVAFICNVPDIDKLTIQ